jgi:ATP-dependent helicase/nuclease subunit B
MRSMNGRIERKFLDWREPALTMAAEYLEQRFAAGRSFDLGQVLIVVPGGRAGRRLLEILVSRAERQGLTLTPPDIVTPEKFPEKLYEAKWPFANVLAQRLAWAQALIGAKPQTLAAFLPHPPPPDDTQRWLAIGETLRRMHLELAADGLDCQRVLQGASQVEGFVEHARWKALCELQQAYLRVLDGLELWDVQTARLVAIQKKEINTDRHVILLGTADLSLSQRQMLDQIADRVTALVVAPAELAKRFDEHGCLLPEQWTDIELPLADEQIERVDGPADQAAAVARWLASLQAQYRADQISIGLPDDKLVPQMQRQLTQCGLIGRWAIGKQLADTGPYRLLKIAADYAKRSRFRDLAALVRHPDVFDWLTTELEKSSGRIDVLGTLDAFAQDHFPAALDAERLEADERRADLLAIHRQVETLIEPLRGKSQALSEWAQPLRAVLRTVYANRSLNRQQTVDRYLAEALESLTDALDELAKVPPALQPTVDARQGCRIVLAELAGQGIAPPADPDAMELLGWLDLPLDDAPATIVTSFNDGLVPSSVTADAFLPNRLRQSLGLLHNDRRLARDAYALATLCASRRNLRVIVARRDSEGNPLPPSRLLFLTSPEQVVARGRWLFGDLPPQPPRRSLLVPPSGPQPRSRLEPPRPTKLQHPITELSVTRFKDYIACPYRFYLRHQLRLQQVADDAAELDGGAFGDMVHWVLEQFGRTEEAKSARESAAATKVAEYLNDKLDQIAAARFGRRQARPAVLVQIEQARLRLRTFAEWQASRVAEGWRIVFSEDSEQRKLLEVDFPVDRQPFKLTGRIDRIDYHDKMRRLAVLDYKTADRGDDPRKTHRCQDEWIDLQLPLYRRLIRGVSLDKSVAADATIDLGYILLPVDLKSVGLKLADWDAALLLSADLKAEEIVRCLREERFWPPTSPPPDFFDDVAVICQDRRMGAVAYEGEAA